MSLIRLNMKQNGIEELKKFLIDSKNKLLFENINNNFVKDSFFDLYSLETVYCGSNYRKTLNVEQIFDDDNEVYSIIFEKKDIIVAYLMVCFEYSLCKKIILNNSVVDINPNIDNFIKIMNVCYDSNIFILEPDDYDSYISMKCSVVYNTEKNKSKIRSQNEQLKKFFPNIK